MNVNLSLVALGWMALVFTVVFGFMMGIVYILNDTVKISPKDHELIFIARTMQIFIIVAMAIGAFYCFYGFPQESDTWGQDFRIDHRATYAIVSMCVSSILPWLWRQLSSRRSNNIET